MKAQQAFELADQLQHFYHSGPGYSEGINTALLNSLGKEKYKQFCQTMAKLKGKVSDPKHFSEAFMDNPVQTECIVDDETIRSQWPLSTIMNAVKKLIT